MTPCCIVYTLKRESADEVAGRLTSKGKPSLLQSRQVQPVRHWPFVRKAHA